MEVFQNKVNETAQKLAEYTNKNVDPDLGITNKLLEDFGEEVTNACVSLYAFNEKFRERSADDANHRFKGVFNIDNLMNRLHSSSWAGYDDYFSFIINLGREEDKYPSGHFVTCLVEERKISYIDSFGLPPPSDNEDLNKCFEYLQEKGLPPPKNRQLFYNKTPIQHISSMSCGLFALCFVLLFEMRLSKKKLTWYKSNLKKNDQRVKNYLIRMIKKCHKDYGPY